ncbi:hypothetical protein THAOC_08136, partial [Thalassiosira oceanica]
PPPPGERRARRGGLSPFLPPGGGTGAPGSARVHLPRGRSRDRATAVRGHGGPGAGPPRHGTGGTGPVRAGRGPRRGAGAVPRAGPGGGAAGPGEVPPGRARRGRRRRRRGKVVISDVGPARPRPVIARVRGGRRRETDGRGALPPREGFPPPPRAGGGEGRGGGRVRSAVEGGPDEVRRLERGEEDVRRRFEWGRAEAVHPGEGRAGVNAGGAASDGYLVGISA